LLKNIQTAG